MLESLKKIKATEEKASKSIAKAEKESAAILDQAQIDAKNLRRQVLENARDEVKKLITRACREADLEAQKIIQAGEEDSQVIRKKAANRIERAVTIIVRHIVGES